MAAVLRTSKVMVNSAIMDKAELSGNSSFSALLCPAGAMKLMPCGHNSDCLRLARC